MSETAVDQVKESGADEVNRMLGVAVDRADALAARMRNRLEGVMVAGLDGSHLNQKADGNISRALSPMFDDQRGRLASLIRYIDEMERMIDRLDL